ncbi:Mv-ORF4 peptide [Maruca vitrata nucleopolyhedrovirus]|uniref:Mv-ORF4 peptide n=1 Tax=Maruca vitrata nucleopolyhedrovirus TaxID=1307954 RepID=A1YR66_9ABAC|nr:Mv-ORF4 peptide [Maruca vitrata nucleopolyhedrovirus]ABL75956.1 Mv-ORF4 peptide [Maruca vitrata nucleopolyhedrovirus]
MSLAAKLIIYNYYAKYNAVHDVYGETYLHYRIVQEYLSESYIDGASCIERDMTAMRRLKSGNCTFDEALKMIDARDSIESLSRWFSTNETMGIDYSVCEVLEQIDAAVPVDVRVQNGRQIFSLNDFEREISQDTLNCLQIILGRFEYFMRNGKLLRLANVFNPHNSTVGWWYNKFCVVTYMHRIMYRSVPAELLPRLSETVKKSLRDSKGDHDDLESFNCPRVIAEIYGRFCGIGKEHFSKHKLSCMHILFQYLRGKTTQEEKSFPCYKVIKNFGRQCKDVYENLKNVFDLLHAHCVSDKDKNALMDLLCVMDCEEIDIDCFYNIFESFIKK